MFSINILSVPTTTYEDSTPPGGLTRFRQKPIFAPIKVHSRKRHQTPPRSVIPSRDLSSRAKSRDPAFTSKQGAPPLRCHPEKPRSFEEGPRRRRISAPCSATHPIHGKGTTPVVPQSPEKNSGPAGSTPHAQNLRTNKDEKLLRIQIVCTRLVDHSQLMPPERPLVRQYPIDFPQLQTSRIALVPHTEDSPRSAHTG
jgi:hypothetical protein